MFWIWFLFLLGIVNAQNTTQGSTAPPDGVTTQASSAPPAPVTQAPVTQAPVTQAPVTQAPVTQAPVTQAPVTEAPTTPTPTQVPTTISTSTTLESINSTYSRKSRKRYVLLQNSYEQLIADLNKKLQAILIAYEPESLGNAELGLWLKRINNIITFEKEYSAKVETYIDFIRYNDQRLQLEDLITDRINKINDLLPNIEPYTICNRFYLNQRMKLKDAFRLSNAEKQTLLKENSSGCPYDIDEYDDDYDYYFYLDYFETK